MVVIGQSHCTRENMLYSGKVVEFVQNLFFSGKYGSFWAKWLYLGKSGCAREKVFLFGQKWL